MIDLLQNLLEESQNAFQEASGHLIPRDLKFADNANYINVAIGMRRTGKTYFLYQTMQQLLQSGIQQEQILLLNFEDERLLPMNAKQMGQLLDAFYTLYPENHQRCCYLLLDEVQNVTDWPLVVRRYLDKKNVRLYLTGSSAKLLSKEIATSLRGRSLTVEVWPFSFAEHCRALQIQSAVKPFGQGQYDRWREYLIDYFQLGGFPGLQTLPAVQWRQTLQSYLDTVILRDIVERHKVSNVNLLNYLCRSLLKNAASPFAINKFYNDINSQGMKVSKTTIYSYLAYLEDAFLLFAVPFYAESARIQQHRIRKFYAIDHSLIQLVSLQTNSLYGKLFENLIYLDLRRQGRTVYYYQTPDQYEVDFVTQDLQGKREIIQVAWDVSDEQTLARERQALEQAQQLLKLPGRLITLRDYLQPDFVL